MEGILLVDKPVGWTSFDVVNRIRGIAADYLGVSRRNLRVGHTGTLDPLASGLMVILIGKKYTSKAAMLTKMDKSYLVEAELGKVTPSYDSETEPEAVSEERPSEKEIIEALASFEGETQQKPPIFSAIKIDGKRAYDIARSGKGIEMKSRTVHISAIKVLKYNYPKLSFKCDVSSGTYIRSLVNDLGIKLTCGAYTTSLRRLTVGDYSIDKAISMDGVNAEIILKNLLG